MIRSLALAPRVALGLLTAVPASLPPAVPAAAFPRAVALFPLVGAALGAIVGLLDRATSDLLPSGVVAVLDLVALALLSGGLHLDGLADAADGLFGGHDRESRLAIMRDSSVGAFGVAAIVLVLLLQWTALSDLPDRLSALIVGAIAARLAMSLAMWAFPYARASGVGSPFKAGLGAGDVAVAAVLATVIVFAVAGTRGLGITVVGCAAAMALAAWSSARLGGLTGDVYGATGEIAFSVALLGAVAAR